MEKKVHRRFGEISSIEIAEVSIRRRQILIVMEVSTFQHIAILKSNSEWISSLKLAEFDYGELEQIEMNARVSVCTTLDDFDDERNSNTSNYNFACSSASCLLFKFMQLHNLCHCPRDVDP